MAIIASLSHHPRYYMSEKQYLQYRELFLNREPAGDWVPSAKEFEKDIFPNFREFLPLLIWIEETGLVTDKNKDTHRYIQKAIKKHLEIEK